MPFFKKLAPELRELVYRAYFEDFVEAKSKVADIRKTAKTFLGSLHSNRAIRNEAGPMFNKDFLCIDKFTASHNLEAELWLRIKSACGLVAIRDVHSKMTIACTTVFKDQDAISRLASLGAVTMPLSSATKSWLEQINFAAELRLFIEREEKKFYKERAIVFDPKIHKGRGFDISFHTEGSGSTDAGACETLCIEGPLAELRWPNSLYKDGSSYIGSDWNDEGSDDEEFDDDKGPDDEESDDEGSDDEEFEGEGFEGEEFEVEKSESEESEGEEFADDDPVIEV